MTRVSLKIVGASGQGINSVGEVLAKALKRSGYCVFGYREYPSLIKGGHASYQLDCSDTYIASSDTTVQLLVTLNHHGLQKSLGDLREDGILIHAVSGWKFSPQQSAFLEAKRIRTVYLPVPDMLAKIGAQPLLGNVLISAFVWAALGQPIDPLLSLVLERFQKKLSLLELNRRCIEEGYRYADPACGAVSVPLPAARDEWKGQMLLTGSHALGLGAVHAGVRFYAGYPMTPSSPLLTYIADIQNQTGMAIKQAEDEITAAQMVSGAMLAGTRALTATSGGGFDLMTETLSLNGLIENPTVFVLAQRPGPATGLPTWTAQADLLMAIHGAHGEFPRCVLAPSSSSDAFALMADAFNLAEEYQLSAIILTDKQLMEALYTQPAFDQSRAQIHRGRLVTDTAKLAELKSTDRYDPLAPDGLSPRWLPGSKAATYCAQGDEHSGDGTSTESADNAILQADKRAKKMEALKRALPDPVLTGRENPDVLVVSWGSTTPVVLDVLGDEQLRGAKISSLHFAYLWPLKTERFQELAKKAKRVVLVEGNREGQLGKLLRQECGIEITDRILKYDGRPFFHDELLSRLLPLLPVRASSPRKVRSSSVA